MKAKKTNKALLLCVVAFLVASCPLFNLLRLISKEKANEACEEQASLIASKILSRVIYDLPFAVLKEGNPGAIDVSESIKKAKYARFNGKWAKDTAKEIFGNNSDKEDEKAYLCAGEVKAANGASYLVSLKVENVFVSSKADGVGQINIGREYPKGAPNEFPKNQRLTFAFIKDPALFSNGTWMQSYAIKKEDTEKPFIETELPDGVAQSPENVYEMEDFLNPVAERKYPDLSENGSGCLLKKLTVQVQYKAADDKIANYHLVSVKGDLD